MLTAPAGGRAASGSRTRRHLARLQRPLGGWRGVQEATRLPLGVKVRYSSRADLSPWFCACCGSAIGLRLETALPAGLKPTLCEAARDPGRRRPEWPRAARGRSSPSELRGRAVPAARRQREPLRSIASWGLGPLHEQIARSREGGVVGRALGAKRVALGPLSRGRYGLGREAPRDGVGVQPPDSQRSISMRIPGGDDAPTRARRSVRSQLAGHIPATTASDAALLVSELVTNSVVHANAGAGRALTVEVTTLDDRLQIAVTDPGSRLDLACSRLTPKPQAASGCCSSTSSARHGESRRTSALLVSGASSCSINPALGRDHAGGRRTYA